MKFQLMQIPLSDAEIDQINDGVVTEKYSNRCDISCFGSKKLDAVYNALEEGYYETVAEIDAESLEGAFYIGNFMGDNPTKVKMIAESVFSVSVGDILVDEDGCRHLVDRFGFVQIL